MLSKMFRLIREAFISHRQVRELKAVSLALKKVFAVLNGLTDLPVALRYLGEAEEMLRKAESSVSQFRARNKYLFNDSIKEQKEEIIAESKIKDTLEFVSGLKLLIAILLEENNHEGIPKGMTKLLDWLGFDSLLVKFSVTDDGIDRNTRKVITIESSRSRTWDDMPENIRRRHLALKQILERRKGEFYYQSDLFQGTKIIIKLPFKKSN